jgi:hypothetical protein
MTQTIESFRGFAPITWRKAAVLGLIGVACFHAAYTPAKGKFA